MLTLECTFEVLSFPVHCTLHERHRVPPRLVLVVSVKKVAVNYSLQFRFTFVSAFHRVRVFVCENIVNMYVMNLFLAFFFS